MIVAMLLFGVVAKMFLWGLLAAFILLLWLGDLFQLFGAMEDLHHYWERRRIEKLVKPINSDRSSPPHES
jgi:putative exporter of polyketide antibiotics